MSYRLPLDPNLLGYWGFDEANETDLALDETVAANHLTVTNPVSVVAGRLGNARQFNGTSSYAGPATSTIFQLLGDLTFAGWVRLDSANNSGSLFRTIASCDGPTTSDGRLWSLYIDAQGKLIYRHDAAGLVVVSVETAAATIKTARYYFIQVRRVTAAGQQTIELRVDHQTVPVTVTVGGVTAAFPINPPAANASATLNIGRSRRLADSAFWHGAVDDLSVHDVARPAQPYLLAAFFGVAVGDVSARLTTVNNLQRVAGTDMLGIRWWTFERDRSLYVVRESPFGNFDAEVQLTTTTATAPGGTFAPSLIYEPTTDTLVVVFVNSGKVYKITANSTDAPTTQNMPFTVDTLSIVKVRELEDAWRAAVSAPQDQIFIASTIGRSPALPTITFGTNDVGFGIIIPNIGATSSWRVFESRGGADVFVGTAVYSSANNTYFFSIPIRTYGASYYARPVPTNGAWPVGTTNVITDYLGLLYVGPTPDYLYWNRYGDNSDYFKLSVGDGVSKPEFGISTITRTPLKMQVTDPDVNNQSVGDGIGDPIIGISVITRTPLKFQLTDPDVNNQSVGVSISGGLIVSNTRYSIFL